MIKHDRYTPINMPKIPGLVSCSLLLQDQEISEDRDDGRRHIPEY
jgi:hypothetical protein